MSNKLYDTLKADLLSARKKREDIKKILLSTLIGDIELTSKRKEYKGDIDNVCLSLIKKYVDNGNEILKVSDQPNTHIEIEILTGYLPKLLSADEVSDIITGFISSNNITDKRIAIKEVMNHLTLTYPNIIDKTMAMKVLNGLF